MSTSGTSRLSRATISSTSRLCPCAESTTITSTPASTSARARLYDSSPTPTAAATRSRPAGVLGRVRVLLALGEVLDRDQAAQPAGVVDQRQLLDLVLAQQVRAPSSVLTPTGAVTSGIGVMTSRTSARLVGDEPHVAVGDDADQHARRASTTGTPEMRYRAQSASTSREGVVRASR